VGVKHEVHQRRQPRRCRRSCTCSWLRDGNPPEGESSFYFTFTGPAMYTDAKQVQEDRLQGHREGQGQPRRRGQRRLGVDGAALLHQRLAVAGQAAARVPQQQGQQRLLRHRHGVPLGDVAAGASKVQDAQLYLGPQEEKKLAALAPGLELVKDYGMVHILAAPLFWLLDQLHGMHRQLGLGHRGPGGAAEDRLLLAQRQRLQVDGQDEGHQPAVMELRERHKDDPQKMQQEMMRIYREEKVNPLGSCLPILVQMPFFIALYWVLLSSVEMRNAPWIGWITDLADKDPWFILPVLMTLSSLFQVWLNPTPPDPMQAKMMWFMPLAFSFMFFFFPAGLVLYWLTNNILSIAQQWFINKRLGVQC
jgi:YidC/Oxa1 family membrane protein insertase